MTTGLEQKADVAAQASATTMRARLFLALVAASVGAGLLVIAMWVDLLGSVVGFTREAICLMALGVVLVVIAMRIHPPRAKRGIRWLAMALGLVLGAVLISTGTVERGVTDQLLARCVGGVGRACWSAGTVIRAGGLRNRRDLGRAMILFQRGCAIRDEGSCLELLEHGDDSMAAGACARLRQISARFEGSGIDHGTSARCRRIMNERSD